MDPDTTKNDKSLQKNDTDLTSVFDLGDNVSRKGQANLMALKQEHAY